jgi:endonuclease/exonuclease/phosphatase family metal-dependent hydrolase
VLGQKTLLGSLNAKGLLALENLILAGDLNFTISPEEVWGEMALADPLADFFKNLFLSNHLVDVMPAVLLPTWRNGRRGEEEIQKRLDRIYVSESLLSDVAKYRSWVESPFFSDHAPVLLQLDYGYTFCGLSF